MAANYITQPAYAQLLDTSEVLPWAGAAL